jgi:hypothetical protein
VDELDCLVSFGFGVFVCQKKGKRGKKSLIEYHSGATQKMPVLS